MKNGTMFSDVTKYREKDFCEKHPYIEFETKGGLKCYGVFAVVCMKKTDVLYKFSYAENGEQYWDKITEKIKQPNSFLNDCLIGFQLIRSKQNRIKYVCNKVRDILDNRSVCLV